MMMMRGLQGVIGGNKGLQDVTRGYRGLQGVNLSFSSLGLTLCTIVFS